MDHSLLTVVENAQRLPKCYLQEVFPWVVLNDEINFAEGVLALHQN